MNCHDIQKRLKPFFEDLLIEEEYQKICEHLEQCEQCRQYATSTGSLSYLLKELNDIEVPKDLTETIRFRLEKKLTETAAGAPHPFKKITAIHRKLAIIGSMAVVILMVGYIAFGKGNAIFKPSQLNTEKTVNDEEQPVTVAVELKRAQRPLSDAEAEHLYHQLQTMAGTLGQVADDRSKEDKVAPTDKTKNSALAPVQPPQFNSASTLKAAPETFSLHWHIPYTDEAEIAQLADTIRILKIVPDYEDKNFIVFSTTGEKLKLLRDGISFASAWQLELPYWVTDPAFPERNISVSIFFIKQDPFMPRAQALSSAAKSNPLVSLEQGTSSTKYAFDWHVLLLPSQRETLFNVIRQNGAKINYASKEVIIFLVNGGGIRKMSEQIQNTGGIFVDFGQMKINDDLLMREMAGVMIYISEN